ncbi:MAG TPA: glycosyltransferase family 4 protein [Thermoleophilaceae bacterium]
MRLLDITPRNCFPLDRGSVVRTASLLRELASRHDVRQLSQAVDGPLPLRARVERHEPFGAYVELRERRLASLVGAQLCARSWARSNVLAGVTQRLARRSELAPLLRWADIVLVEFPWQFEACRRAAPPGTPLVLAGHNVESEKFRSWADAHGIPRHRRAGWLAYIKRAERAAIAHADLVIAVSEPDRQTFVERFGVDPERVVLAPNGADTTRIRPTDPAARVAARRTLGLPERPTVLFQAADMPANAAALGWVRRLATLDRSRTFLVVGKVARPERSGNLVATGPVPDMQPFLAAADAALCPVAHGGGTKIKLLESMAAGLPLVAFPEALSGTEARDGEHVLCAEHDERSLLRCLDALFNDGGTGERLAANARRLVEERYDWAQIARELEPALVAINPRAAAGSRREYAAA